MPAHRKLTDRQRKQMIADRAEGMTFRDIGKKHGVSDATVRRACKADPEMTRLVAEKKEQNTQDVFEYLASKRGKFQDVMEICFDILTDPNRYSRASAQSVATTMGILIDKYTNLAQIMSNGSGANNELLQSLHDLETERRENGY